MSKLTVEQERGVTIISPTTKRLDAAVALRVKAEIVAVIQESERRVVLDLHQVDFMDSSGLGAMVSVLKAIGPNHTLALCNIKGSVLSLFQLTRMDKVFSILPTRREAVDKLAP